MEFRHLKYKLFPVAVIFGTLMGIVVVLSTLTLWGPPNELPQCRFTFVKPKLKSHKNIASEDLTTLASFSSYIRSFRYNKQEYLPLELIKVTNGGSLFAPEITLVTDCAQIVLSGDRFDDNHIHFHLISVALNEPMLLDNVTSLESWKDCEILQPGIDFDQSQGWACDKSELRTCATDNHQEDSPVALVIESLRFELNGDPEKIKRGEYSKPARRCLHSNAEATVVM